RQAAELVLPRSYLRDLPPTGAFIFGPAPGGWIARVGAMALAQPFVLVHPVLVPPPQSPALVHEVLSRLRTAASSKLPLGLCAENAVPLMSTLPAESITTSEDRARAVRAAATDVAAPTASAAFSSNPRRLTPWSPLLMGSLDIAHSQVDHTLRIGKMAHRSSRGTRAAALYL